VYESERTKCTTQEQVFYFCMVRIIGKVPEGERSRCEKKQESGCCNLEGDQDVMRSKN